MCHEISESPSSPYTAPTASVVDTPKTLASSSMNVPVKGEQWKVFVAQNLGTDMGSS